MENVISEFRVIETDDGFRIEIKGDKEKLRPFFTGGFGPGRWGHRHGRRGPWGGGPGFRPGFMRWMMMGGPWWGEWGEEPEEEEPGPGPEKSDL